MNKKALKQAIEELFRNYRTLRLIDAVGENERARKAVDLIERIVNQIPENEQKLIRSRYMDQEADYLTDGLLLEGFDPPISRPTFYKWRDSAFSRIYEIIISLDDAVGLKQFFEGVGGGQIPKGGL